MGEKKGCIGLICIFLASTDIEYLIICLLTICMLPYVNRLARFFYSVLFLLFSGESSLNISNFIFIDRFAKVLLETEKLSL